MTTIKKGSKGNAVKILQLYLKIEADGIFGKQTKAAVENFQRSKRMEATGIITNVEWAIISQDLPVIKKGNKGDAVKIWQLILNVNADGIFGNTTYNQTRAFQAAANLTIDGVVGKNTWTKGFLENINIVKDNYVATNNKKNPKPVDNKQYDSRWGSVVYTKNNTYSKRQTIRNSGCGPSSMSDIVATWWDKNATPKTLAALAVQKGYRTENSGTAWGFFKFCANKYGASKFIQTTSYATAEAAIKNGAYVVCSMRPGLWTKGGHFICWWWVDDTYVYVNDPASAASARAKAKKNLMKEQCKQYFIFYK
jgi:peptidoglycan hydrolase-like protein with peptidoglycan-binding domain